MRNVLAILAGLALLGLVGCAKVSDSVSKELKPNEDASWMIPANKSGLKVEVKIESTGKLAGCLIPATKQGEAVALGQKRPASALAYEKDQGSFTLSGTFPPDEEGSVMIVNVGTEPTTVKVNITGR